MKHSYLKWFVITKRRNAALLVEPKIRDANTPEGFHDMELGYRSDLYERAIAHNIPFKSAIKLEQS